MKNKPIGQGHAGLGFICSWVFGMLLVGGYAEGACPGTKDSGWTANGTVYYSTSGFTSAEVNQINSSISNWHR